MNDVDLDCIVKLLEEDECESIDFGKELFEDEEECAEERFNFPCSSCSKVYKTKSGLTRHFRAKNSTGINGGVGQPTKHGGVDKATINLLVSRTCQKLSEHLYFPEEMRSVFQQFSLSATEGDSVLQLLGSVINSYTGNSEKFYSSFYRVFVDNHVFHDISLELSTPLGHELCNFCLEFC